MKTYAVLSRLLAYPEPELIAALPELAAALDREGALAPAERAGLGRLIDALASGDPIDAQADYVRLFDRTRTLSLHVYEHLHGDSRERGQAMVALVELYRRHGLDVTARELPDYLPLVLEFLSRLEPAHARALLAEMVPTLTGVESRLVRRASAYAAAFAALRALAHSDARVPAAPAEEDESPEALDRAWEEAAVVFGADATPDAHGLNQRAPDAGCDRAAAIVARFDPTP